MHNQTLNAGQRDMHAHSCMPCCYWSCIGCKRQDENVAIDQQILYWMMCFVIREALGMAKLALFSAVRQISTCCKNYFLLLLNSSALNLWNLLSSLVWPPNFLGSIVRPCSSAHLFLRLITAFFEMRERHQSVAVICRPIHQLHESFLLLIELGKLSAIIWNHET